MDYAGFSVPYYNIPSNNRELQLLRRAERNELYYNIPSNNRELQLHKRFAHFLYDYNIPSNNRELQHSLVGADINVIITYQVITGNYNARRTGY